MSLDLSVKLRIVNRSLLNLAMQQLKGIHKRNRHLLSDRLFCGIARETSENRICLWSLCVKFKENKWITDIAQLGI